jgi:hypothetical protein
MQKSVRVLVVEGRNVEFDRARKREEWLAHGK